jgi:peptidoglycan hydrolase CwlO-like protein
MKKIIIWLSIIWATIWISLAIDSNILRNNLNNSYTNLVNNGTNIYNKYKNVLVNINDKLNTWDYSILSQLTWIDTKILTNNLNNNYTNLIKEITTNKLNIVW